MSFDSLENTPDLMLGKGKRIIFTYNYRWGLMHRTRTWRTLLPFQIHLRDFIKIRLNALRNRYAEEQEWLGGSPPEFYNMHVEILDETLPSVLSQ